MLFRIAHCFMKRTVAMAWWFVVVECAVIVEVFDCMQSTPHDGAPLTFPTRMAIRMAPWQWACAVATTW